MARARCTGGGVVDPWRVRYGFLPYGVTDPSVLLQVSMTSLAEMQAISAATGSGYVNAAPSFDATRGMKPDTSYGWFLRELTGWEKLDAGGQISIEVERKLLAYIDADSLSSGDDTSAQSQPPTILACQEGTGTGPTYIDTSADYRTIAAVSKSATTKYCCMSMVAKSTPGSSPTATTVTSRFDAVAKSPAVDIASYLHSCAHDEWVTLNFGWDAGYYYLGVDGQLWYEQPIDEARSGVFRRLYIGGIGGVAGYTANNWYVRNLQISHKPPRFMVGPFMGTCVFWGDSFPIGDSYASTATAYAGHANAIMSGAARKEITRICGRYFGTMTVDSDAGYSVAGSSKLSANIANVTALSPSMVIIVSGANDQSVGAGILTTYDSEWKSLLTSLFAADVRRVVVTNCATPRFNSSYVNNQSVVEGMNTITAALPDWDSRVTVADIYAATGGWDSDSSYWIGGLNGSTNDLHPSPLGQYLIGTAIGEAVTRAIGYRAPSDGILYL